MVQWEANRSGKNNSLKVPIVLKHNEAKRYLVTHTSADFSWYCYSTDRTNAPGCFFRGPRYRIGGRRKDSCFFFSLYCFGRLSHEGQRKRAGTQLAATFIATLTLTRSQRRCIFVFRTYARTTKKQQKNRRGPSRILCTACSLHNKVIKLAWAQNKKRGSYSAKHASKLIRGVARRFYCPALGRTVETATLFQHVLIFSPSVTGKECIFLLVSLPSSVEEFHFCRCSGFSKCILIGAYNRMFSAGRY